MKIALLGANGMVGRRILLEALNRGHEVKALVRHPNEFTAAHPRLTVGEVDIFDPGNVGQAISDSDVLVNATGPGQEDAKNFYEKSAASTIQAVQQSGDKRLLVVGGAGTLEVAPGVKLLDTPNFPENLRTTAEAQAATLDQYRTSSINWTFFSPSANFAPGKRTGKVRLGKDQLLTNDQGESYLSEEDGAVVLLNEIEQPQFQKQRFTAVSLEK